MDRPNPFGLDRGQLAQQLSAYGAPRFHADQVYRWLHARRAYSPDQWTDLGKGLRARLAEEWTVDPGTIVDRTEADDGTIKYRVRLAGGGEIECVHMVQRERVTLCLSSQVGCALGCEFCLTGRMGLGRHLSPGEIVGQVALIQDDRALERPFNVVFMGMGEPLHNFDGVVAALQLLQDPDGFGLSRQRMTVSTVGLVPAIERLARETVRPRLAVSLNATRDALRDRLMPINKRHPIAELLGACRAYASASGQRVTLEYVLLAGVNDGEADADRLAEIARGLPARVNLIPFNPVPGWLPFRAPERARVMAVRDRVVARGAAVSVRWSRGAGARAACGQLALLPEGP